MKKYPSQEYIKNLFYLDLCAGELYWKVDKHTNKIKGKKAGSFHKGKNRNYIEVSIDHEKYQAHRILWIYANGEIPDGLQIDHINHNRIDNRLDNLRLVTNSENQKNRSLYKSNKSGHAGISWSKCSQRWHAYIFVNKKVVFLGYYKLLNDAIKNRKLAEEKYGYHFNNGRNI